MKPEDLARTPVQSEALQVGAAATVAAGIPAVISTMRHAARQTGLWRGTKLLLAINQQGGFDCQSCAWPNPEHRHTAEFCENGAKAALDEGTTRRADRAFFAAHSIEALAKQSDYWLGQQGRLSEPMQREGDHYVPIAWDDAFQLIARELRARDPDQATFYTSGRTSNEAAFLYQLMVRRFGTNNLPDCSNMCHESSGVALNDAIGVGKGTVTLDDFERAQLIVIFGQNPGTNHPRMLSALQAAKNRGCKIVDVNPLVEAGTSRFKNPQQPFNTLFGGTKLADLHLPVRIGGDHALLKGVGKHLYALERERGSVFDRAFLAHKTHGVEAYLASLEATSWAQIERESGLARAQLLTLATMVAEHDNIIACWAMGLTQHVRAVATIRELVNVLLLRGSIGRPGAGVCPVRGHSNVQGDRTMGIWEKPPDSFLDRLQARFGFAPPRAHGLDVVDSIKAMHEGRVRVLLALGGNFLSATPDTDFTARALANCALTVHVSTKLNRSHLVTGERALILPCLGRSERDLQAGKEQFVTVEDSMGIISASRGVTEPASAQLRSEPAIIAGIAQALFAEPNQELDYDQIRDDIEAVVPGFEDFNRRVRRGTFALPNAARDGVFHTTTARANFSAEPVHDAQQADDELAMMTLRSHDQFNTTVYGLDDRYRGIHGGRRVVFMHPEDIAARALQAGALVDLSSEHNGVRRVAPSFRVVPYALPRGQAATYFPETNVLVSIDSVAERSNTPSSKYVRIRVHQSAG
ncbi:MAG TPA: FdhF/YdeP family oxidoreductase [Polyangiales bacterium]|nr:FdhF/YdeP family oxidoreductase [Polyangiales bacterium]